jgi:hypothetical protein
MLHVPIDQRNVQAAENAALFGLVQGDKAKAHIQGDNRRESCGEIGGGGFLVNATRVLTAIFTRSLGPALHSSIAKCGRFGECPRRNPRCASGAADPRIGKVPGYPGRPHTCTNAFSPRTYKELGDLPL